MQKATQKKSGAAKASASQRGKVPVGGRPKEAGTASVVEGATASGPTSSANPPSQTASWDAWVAHTYDQSATAMRKWVDQLALDAAGRERAAFAVEQCLAAMHPDNFLATNKEALKLALDSKGATIERGVSLMLADMAKGRVSNTDEAAFEVGRDLATTPGKVVMRNALVELIQYAPTTKTVHALPLLIVPPCINKFYILDLSSSNSFVRHAVDQGHTVFMVSWRNPGSEQASMGWDDYLQLGVVDTIAAVRAICKTDQLNALGFCVGGTILATALAALAAQGERPAASLTLLTTLLDFSEVGQLGMFVDEASVAYREASLGSGGVLSGKELATTFSLLRPRDLLWNYVSNGYLKGEAPAAFDLLYWNADSTNLPGPMYAWYLRNLYLENRLQSGSMRSLGTTVNLRTLDMPAFVYASREDHIVPWRTAFLSTQLLGGASTFVLGASGHIAGVVNPPARKKRSYWSGALMRAGKVLDADAWLAEAPETPGSWWGAWSDWLAKHGGPSVSARRTLGNKQFGSLGDAPGEYVKVRI